VNGIAIGEATMFKLWKFVPITAAVIWIPNLLIKCK